ncbi:DUF3168 domain-containing protein [uncultured Bartonella sp.]|uniref:DUF3168 domain-containing protein n=1 Tax=uncultured Bartonella sp. TaxID=104108 RepID=UPI0025F9FBBD|nr:DUF3168 domain-containing protein [uncultured Bartonella sp.]
MMKAATSELQKVIIQTLSNDADVKDIVDGRVFDSVPLKAEYPYISLGPMTSDTTLADCLEIDNISVQIDVWSCDVSSVEMRELANAVRRALTKSDLTLEKNGLVLFNHENTRELRDPDGLTSHAAVNFDVIVERFD